MDPRAYPGALSTQSTFEGWEPLTGEDRWRRGEEDLHQRGTPGLFSGTGGGPTRGTSIKLRATEAGTAGTP